MVLPIPITDKSKQNQTHFFRDKAAPKQLSDIRVAFLDQELTPVSSVKDLGITLDSYLNFNDQSCKHVNIVSPLHVMSD